VVLMEPKQIYIARRAAGLTEETYPARWRQHGSFVRTLPLWKYIRHYEQCRALRAAELGGAPIPGVAEEIDMVGMVWFRSPEAVDGALADPSVGQVYDDERETFAEPIADTSLFTREVVGRDEGATKIKIVAFVQRRAGTTREEFSQYWEHRHGPLFLGATEVTGDVTKYVQNHVLPSNTGPMDEFDGVVEIGFRTIGDLQAAFNHPAYLDVIRPDEQRFLNLERMIVVITDETLLYEDAL
jgi:uncharacterized protein (TIGR02118 family)